MENELQNGYIAKFEKGYLNAHGIVEGLKAIESGQEETITFVVAEHPAPYPLFKPFNPEAGKVHHVITVGKGKYDGEVSWRICGQDGTPDGLNSHALISSGDDQSLEYAVANLCMFLFKFGSWVFRQPTIRVNDKGEFHTT